jgi:hypothetical protein
LLRPDGSRRAIESGLRHNFVPADQRPLWAPEESALLGTLPDE